MPITADTVVQISMGKVLGLVAAMAAGAWGIIYFGTHDLEKGVDRMGGDIKAIRTSLENATNAFQAADKDGILRLREAEIKLSEQIAGLRTDIGAFRGDLALNNKQLVVFSERLGDLQKQIQARQANYSDPKWMDAYAAGLNRALKSVGYTGGPVILLPVDTAIQPPR
jgi:hypothetical protein